jgi:hypothetical protein
MTSVSEIQNLISILPEKDIEIALQFVKQRNFEELQLLVDSDVTKFEKLVEAIDPDSDEYLVAVSNLDTCIQLKNCVDEYLSQFDVYIEEDDEFTIDDSYDMSEEEYYDHLFYMYTVEK